MSTEVRISQNTAILLEHARGKGLSDEVILEAVRSGDTTSLDTVSEEHFTYEDFLSYAQEHNEPLEQAVREGYRITFNTRNGLKIWLEKAFGLQSDRDFQVGEGVVSGLSLTAEQTRLLEQRLAPNWVIAESVNTAESHELTLKLRALA
ncbi:hypothetical protein Q5741_15140 [Paenibacillus sp. JX-17]|uniref:Uncharacterized protein n=1 Tax=Paenibacillus lacisoli TaxID=3064525 RepID=A0ABT9CEP8_9BACL|nr:hypothetical protein [Paenibacillus sp. JX-17]MDO7907745.1 hypothetical protein [Paenibacillus sp. JX-17]